MRRIALASRSIGAVLVHAEDAAAKRFTLRCAESIESPQEGRTPLPPIETIAAAFE